MARKQISAEEFQRAGYLQEVNRQFLHPLGLAVQVIRDEDGSLAFGGVWDARDDPEGIVFADPEIDSDDARRKALHIHDVYRERAEVRENALGYVVQPVPAARKHDTDSGSK